MILKLKIEIYANHPFHAGAKWQRIIEIEEDTLLEDLHMIIQALVDFDNDHLYEFFIANEFNSREKTRFDDENSLIYDTTIGELYPLDNHKKIFYLFDYGDSWLFRISKAAPKAKKPDPNIEYPILISEIGENPEQYPDDEEW